MAKEAETRKNIIDKQLTETGWSMEKGNLKKEFFLHGPTKHVHERTEEYSSSVDNAYRGFADYALLDENGKPLAIVEAKRDKRSPLEGMEQAREYADYIYAQTGKRPFIFLTNGEEIYFWEVDLYVPRLVSNFYTARDLMNLEKKRLYSQQLHLFEPKTSVVDREYQKQAIRVNQTIERFLRDHSRYTATQRRVIYALRLYLLQNVQDESLHLTLDMLTQPPLYQKIQTRIE